MNQDGFAAALDNIIRECGPWNSEPGAFLLWPWSFKRENCRKIAWEKRHSVKLRDHVVNGIESINTHLRTVPGIRFSRRKMNAVGQRTSYFNFTEKKRGKRNKADSIPRPSMRMSPKKSKLFSLFLLRLFGLPPTPDTNFDFSPFLLCLYFLLHSSSTLRDRRSFGRVGPL